MKTTYKVLTGTKFRGHGRSEEFEAELSEAEERHAIERGWLTVVKKPKTKRTVKEEVKEDG